MVEKSFKTELKKFDKLRKEAEKKAQDSSGLPVSSKWFNIGKATAYGNVVNTLKKKKYWK